MDKETKVAGWSTITAIAAVMVLMTTEFDKDVYWALGWLIITAYSWHKASRAEDQLDRENIDCDEVIY